MKYPKKLINMIVIPLIIALIAAAISYILPFSEDIGMAPKAQSIVDTLSTIIRLEQENKIADGQTEKFLKNIGVSEKLKDIKEGTKAFTKEEIEKLQEKFPDHVSSWFSVSINMQHRWIMTVFVFLLAFSFSMTIALLITTKTPEEIMESQTIQNMIREEMKSALLTVSEQSKTCLISVREEASQAKRDIETQAKSYFETTLRDFLEDEKLYNGIRSSHITILDKDRMGIIKSFINQGECGITLVLKGCDLGTYAKWAIELDKSAKYSIYSTNLVKACELFQGYKKQMIVQHLKAVNEVNNIDRARIQVIDPTWNAMSFFDNKSDIKKLYCENFIAENSKISFRWTKWNDIRNILYGDYIVYDKMIVLRYFETLEVLELVTGKIVEKYLEVFDKTRMQNYGTSKTFPFELKMGT